MNSFFLAFSAATAATILGAILGFLMERVKVPGRTFIDWLATLPYPIPGTFVAIAMILAWLHPIPLLGFGIYNTIWILLVAYAARYLVFGPRAFTRVFAAGRRYPRGGGARKRRDPVAGGARRLIPLLRPAMRSSWILVFSSGLQELRPAPWRRIQTSYFWTSPCPPWTIACGSSSASFWRACTRRCAGRSSSSPTIRTRRSPFPTASPSWTKGRCIGWAHPATCTIGPPTSSSPASSGPDRCCPSASETTRACWATPCSAPHRARPTRRPA